MNPMEIIEELKRLGLTEYEAKCYFHLVINGPTDPRRIAIETGLPIPNSYEALRRLSDLGWVELIKKRPSTYRARQPSAIKRDISRRLDLLFDYLEERYKSAPTEETELVYTIRGKERVISKMLELIEGARESIIMASPSTGLIKPIVEELSNSLARGIKVKVITDEEGLKALSKGFDLRLGSQLAIDLLIDSNIAMISLPDFSACGWTDSEQVAYHFVIFLELLWNTSKVTTS